MEALLVLLAFAVPISFIWLLFSHIAMRGTVQVLREDVDRLKAMRPGPAEDTAGTARPAAATSPWDTAAQPPPLPETPPAPEQAAEPDAPHTPPKSYVFATENVARVKAWVQENWLIVIGALSLAMAGIFLVQYSIESGLLSPPLRVLSALGFGGALIGFGEWVRRRGGDADGDATAFLPSAFAGAGIVTLFSGIIAARQLYALIGAEAAFAGLIAIAALAVLIGWFYGSFVSVIGILGAVGAPFVVGGEAESAHWLFYYFALIVALGLGVDAMKRSAWISTVGVVAPSIGAALLWLGTGSEHALAFAALLALATTCIPSVSLRPAFEGAMTFRMVHFAGEPGWPEFPTRLAAGGFLALAGAAVFVSMSSEAGFWLALFALGVALAALAFWFDRSAVLDDLAVPVALAMLAIIGVQGLLGLPVAGTMPVVDATNGIGEAEAASSSALTLLVGFGLGMTILAGIKSLTTERFALPWAAGAALFAPATVLLTSQLWSPLDQFGDIAWAAHVMAVAMTMTVLVERTRRQEPNGGLRTAVFALAGLNMVALAMSILLTETALTLGFAAIVASAAWLDRRFDLRPVSWFVQLGVVACGFRLVVNPGLFWALDANIGAMAVAFLGVIALLSLAWVLLRARDRTGALVVTESAIWGLAGIFICVLIFRALDDGNLYTHWSFALFAMIWLMNAAIQLYRAQIGGMLRSVRLCLGTVFGGLGLILLTVAATLANPLYNHDVIGPPIFDSLMVSYLLPALLLAGVAWKFTHLHRWARIGFALIAVALTALYTGLEIRRLWQGPDIRLPGVAEGELYSYTIAMLLCGSGLLVLAFLRRSAMLRKAAIGVIALTIAKVFLVDMAGLEGLIRALSFLALGIVLAGLALLNRWITQRLET